MSELEEMLVRQICELDRVIIPIPCREFRFAAPRRWRFDFAWPERKLAVVFILVCMLLAKELK